MTHSLKYRMQTGEATSTCPNAPEALARYGELNLAGAELISIFYDGRSISLAELRAQDLLTKATAPRAMR